jgi:hypothetical protein
VIRHSIKGGKELDALLQQLPVEVETKILRNALLGRECDPRRSAPSAAQKRSHGQGDQDRARHGRTKVMWSPR